MVILQSPWKEEKYSCSHPAFGFALQIRVDGTAKNTLEYEIVQVVDTGPILRDMAFSVDHEHLYIMSEKQVRNCFSPWCFESFSLDHAMDIRFACKVLIVNRVTNKTCSIADIMSLCT